MPIGSLYLKQWDIINSLTTVGYLLEVFIELWDTFHGLYFHFYLELALET